MNDNWLEIVETLQPYIKGNSSETKYQQEIENCLKFLGWRSSNKTMQSQVTIPIGNKNSIRPDIVLYKSESPVLPIEIKRPGNTCNEKQENQLMSYMRQLKLNVGLYIGENIQLYYDNPDDHDNPIKVLVADLKNNDINGAVLCDLLNYEHFDIYKLEDFCKERYNQIIARNNLQQRLSEFFSSDNAVKNVMLLIKDKFVKEGYDRVVLDEEFCKLSLDINWNKEVGKLNKESIPDSGNDITSKFKFFSFDGTNFYCKRRFVLELIKKYIKDNPNITFIDLERQFPSQLHTPSLGVVKTWESVRERIAAHSDLKNRYFLKDILVLSDGTKVVVNNQWGTHFPKFLDRAKVLYPKITGSEDKLGIAKGIRNLDLSFQALNENKRKSATKIKLTLEDGNVIMRSDSTSTIKDFIEHIGVDKVASLNLPGRKNTPFICKERSREYGKYQHEMNHGYFLLLNHSTAALKRIIERIAIKLGTTVQVEILDK